MQHPIEGFVDVLSVLPELWQSAAEGASTVERMKKFLVTLIYINSKDAATNLKHVLDKWCLRAGFKNIVQLYHADLTDEHRSKILMLINTGKILIVICTDAFGMGANCRAILRVIQLKLFGGVLAWWQRMGRAGRDFADEAEAILFVEPTHMTAEMRKHIAATGELPTPPEIDEVDEDGPITLENDVALIWSGTHSWAVAKKIVYDELLMLARHGLERDACILRLVLDHLAQPKAETLPRHEELYHSSRPIPPGREMPCCSTCDYQPLPCVPEEFALSKETISALPGITSTQSILRGRLEAWRSKQWPEKWKGLNRAGRMGIDAFMAEQDIDAVDVVLPDLQKEIVAVLREEHEQGT
ncbi:unnamed protein product [Tilletia controversa]|nr:unnamed protein product [Tilletia controversa]